LAGRLDSLGVTRQRSEFFARTTNAVCAAIEVPDNTGSVAILNTHLQRIEHQRLRSAFEAVLCLEKAPPQPARPLKRPRQRRDLWIGLRDTRCGTLRQE
jgi:hypothetical protein